MEQQPIPLRRRQTNRRPAGTASGRPAGGSVEPVPRAVVTATLDPTRLPALAEGLVARPRIWARLDTAIERPLTLVNAPAGTGKTVAVASWALGCPAPGPVVWVTVGAADLVGAGLWALVVEELHHHGLTIGSPLPGPGSLAYDRVFLFALARQLARRPDPLVLVVDVECPLPAAAAAGLHYLVQHAAGRVRLVLLTRQEPPLPVWRYRLDTTMTELRMADLEFTLDETRALLRAHGVVLGDGALAELVRRTRGWAVGLRLAARALAALPDPDTGVAEVRGDVDPLAAYLRSEMLEPQPAGVRALLLQTSGVDLLRPGLVEVLGGRRAARELDELLRRNVLLETVPGMPGGYRYHPLLRELLRSRQVAESPERAVDLDRAAAAWKARNGLLLEAVGDAVARGAWAEACGYVIDHLGTGELLADPPGPLAQTFARMPGAVPGAAPALVRAAHSLAAGDPGASRTHLERAVTRADADVAPPLRFGLGLVRLALSAGAGPPLRTLQLADAAEATLAAQSETAVAVHPELAALITAARAVAHAELGDLEAAADALDTDLPPVAIRFPGLARGMLALARACRGSGPGDPERSHADLTDPRLRDLPGWLAVRLRSVTPPTGSPPGSAARLDGHRLAGAPSPEQVAAGLPALVEPLTGREREVLTLLADLLTTEEIAGALFVSVNTVRTHVRSILRKLGANRRNEAIRRARALHILPDAPTHVGITHYG